MLISKTVMVKWNGFTRKWYESKGYVWTKQNDEFECRVEDLPLGSTAKVLVDCDYKKDGCEGVHLKPYRQYIEDKDNNIGNCCTNRKCGASKTKDICLIKYGVDNIQKLEETKIKSRKSRRKPFSLFENKAREKNLILITTEEEYTNKETRIRFICLNHKEYGIQETNAETFLKNKGCCKYGKGNLISESSKLDGNLVYQAFIDKGLLPQFKPEDYKKNNQLLPFVCPDHMEKGIQETNYATLLASPHKCYYCGKEHASKLMRLDQDLVFDYYKNRGLIIEDGEEYKGKDIHIKFRCPHHIEYVQEVTYNGLKRTKQPCEFCRAEESLASLNRRLRSSIGFWRKESKKNCNYKCVFTGSKNYDIHHLYPFNNIIKDALSELGINIKNKYLAEEFIKIKNKVIELHNKYPLGVCISNNIHTLFHQLYSKDALIQDFEEFKIRYNLGEFNEILKEVS